MIIFGNKFQKHISGYFNRYNFEKNFVNVKIIQNKIELSKYYCRKIFISYWDNSCQNTLLSLVINSKNIFLDMSISTISKKKFINVKTRKIVVMAEEIYCC